MNKKFTTWALAAGLCAALLAGPALEHAAEPPAHVVPESDYREDPRFQRDYRECMKALGPDADLIRIEGTNDFVCRKVAIESTPIHVMHRYAALGVQR